MPGFQLPIPGHYCYFRNTQFVDMHGSPDGNFYYDKGMIQRTIMVANDGVDQAILDFAGYATVMDGPIDGDGLHRYIARVLPHQFPTRQWMIVQGVNNINRKVFKYSDSISISGEPEGVISNITGDRYDGTALPRYKFAEMGLQYVMPTFKVKTDAQVSFVEPTDPTYPYNFIPDEGWALAKGWRTYSRYVTRIIKHQSKMITLPAGLLRDNTAQKRPILEGIAVNENVGVYEYTWHQVPEDALPENTWILAKNTVNDAVFDGQPAGTLLFNGAPEVTPEPNPITGLMYYKVKYTLYSYMLIDPIDNEIYGHNYIRRLVETSSGPPPVYKIRVVKLTTDGVGAEAGATIFPSFDFRKLFRPDVL